MTSGFLNFLKPPGMTSHDVVSFVRRTYGLKKVGHAGTLDPAAAGVLPVAIGQATRLIEYMTNANKQYRVELTFGYETDSGDEAGQITAKSPVRKLGEQEIQAALAAFLGTIEQTPPIYSAIKQGGKKLYELAREGKTVEVPSRKVEIEAIDLLAVQEQSVLFDVICSKGTYIRSLGRDLARSLHMHGTVTFLLRTAVGGFSIASAATAEEIAQEPLKYLVAPSQVLRDLPMRQLNDKEADDFIHGRFLLLSGAVGTTYAVFTKQGDLLGIGKQSDCGKKLLPQKVLGAEERL
ncbi:MAG: tRNA pseudouridine(55) synthase TruB [Sporomusaceae bacterium]|nr:tRNA pseudouridine(55) synthase TruB [Sporomusaceae bacterium]